MLTPEQLLAAVPENVTILSVITDMQGHDLKVAKSASLPSLRRVRRYQAEVYCGAYDGGYSIDDNSAARGGSTWRPRASGRWWAARGPRRAWCMDSEA